ncbi:MAG: winged-helix domain-containing protein [Anaerolineae bacterium]|nr:winged-helix domain-containing protein [Anaerolineae bacterium]
MSMHILLIENNNLNQAESLVSVLENQACQIVVAHTPETAAKKVDTLWPNLIVFNPTNCRQRLSSFQNAIDKVNLNIPYIIVGDEDQAFTKTTVASIFVAPGNPDQLARGIEKAAAGQKDRFIRFPKLIVDCQRRQILCDNKRHHLTPKELKLLHLLIEYQNQDLSRKTIMKEVWETDYMGDTRTLDVHIRWLREKIEENPSRPQYLVTIRGIGYRLIVHPE